MTTTTHDPESMAESTALLEVEHLAVTFDTEDGPVLAVKDMSFTLNPGEILALVGESGCGKSVTAMSIPGLLPTHGVTRRGTVRLAGRDLTSLAERELEGLRGREISVVFQEPMTSLNPAYPVGKQIAEVIQRHQRVSRRQAWEQAAALLAKVGIPDARRRCASYPHQLSGGMRQRVMIAMAVACDPKVLIADEPTTALDVTIQAGVLEVIRSLCRELGTAVVLITHDLGVVAQVADRVVVMYAGRAVEQAPVRGLFAAPQHPYTMGLMGALPANAVRTRATRLAEIAGLVPAPVDDPDECQFAPRCGRASAECRAARPVWREVQSEHWVACYHPGRVGREGEGDV